jgi:ribose transport system substrate-binding protein
MLSRKGDKEMKRLTAGLVTLPLLLWAAGCQRGSQPSPDKPTIALVLKTLNNPFFIDMKKGAEETAAKLGASLIVQAAEREVDVDKQMQIIENLIQSKVSALCVTPSGSKEVVPAIVKANRAGIPVVIVDTRVDAQALTQAGGKVAGFIGSDNFEGGKLAGEFIVKRLGGKGKVAILEGIPGHETGDSRMKGFHSALQGHPEIQVVASQTANWERDQGYNVFQNILQSHPDVQALFACSDLMALGAVEGNCLREEDRDNSRRRLRRFFGSPRGGSKGTMEATIAQSPYEMGSRAVETLYRLLKGDKVEEDISVKIQLITR